MLKKQLTSNIKNIDIVIISANTNCIVSYLKKTQILALLIKYLKYQAKKKVRIKTDLKTIITKKSQFSSYIF